MGGPLSGKRRINICLHEFEKFSLSDLRHELERPSKLVRLTHCCAIVGDRTLKIGYRFRGVALWLPVEIAYTKPNYGGKRAWLRCPSCRGLCNDLYFTGGIFECRACTGASYRSEGESYSARMRRRWLAIAHLVHPKAVLPTFPERAKGMSNKRYERLKAKADGLERRYVDASNLSVRLDAIEAGRYEKLR